VLLVAAAAVATALLLLLGVQEVAAHVHAQVTAALR
jgi:hypothetical protein